MRIWVTHCCLLSASIHVISEEIESERENELNVGNKQKKKKPGVVDDGFSPNRNNLLSFPAGFHVLLITLCYLVPQNYMLLNGLLMVIGFSTF